VIKGTEIEDARLAIEDDKVYVCQNVFNGKNYNGKLGYVYSWCISSSAMKYEVDSGDCEDIELLKKTIEDIDEGDILIDEYNRERMVLGRAGKVYFVSNPDCFDKAGIYYTIEEIKEKFKLKVAEPEPEPEPFILNGEKYTLTEELKKILEGYKVK
jgi:hypothetical protein